MGRLGKDDLESLGEARLDKSDREELFAAQRECSFVFLGDNGWPSGVVMNYLLVEGRFWLTSVEGRAQVRALANDQRVSLVVSSAGSTLRGRRMVAVRGVATLHRDLSSMAWLLDAFAEAFRPADPAPLRQLLDSPNRVVFEVRPVGVSSSHDHRKIPGVRSPGPGR